MKKSSSLFIQKWFAIANVEQVSMRRSCCAEKDFIEFFDYLFEARPHTYAKISIILMCYFHAQKSCSFPLTIFCFPKSDSNRFNTLSTTNGLMHNILV